MLIAQIGRQYEKNRRNPDFFLAIFTDITPVPTTWIRNKFLYTLIPCYLIYYPISHHSVTYRQNFFTHPSGKYLLVPGCNTTTKMPGCLHIPMPNFLGTGCQEPVHKKIVVPTCCSYAKNW